MIGFRAALCLGAALVISATSATAADLYGDSGRGSFYDDYGPAPNPPASWYLRIDGGYATHDRPNMVEAGIYDLTGASIEDTWTIGGGIGRYFGRGVRGDITYDHRFESDVRATNLDPVVSGSRRFGLESDVILANLYYDFDFRSHFTPYIGIGLGAVNHRTSRGTAITCGCADTIESNDDWHVAGALMTGFSVALGRRTEARGSIKDEVAYVEPSRPFHLDVGYRFLYLGETKTGALTSGGVFSSGGITVEDIHAHEFRFGLRWDIR